MASWKVIISDKAQKEFVEMQKNKTLSQDDQDIIRSWVKDIINYGINNIMNSKKWNDHALHGEWQGYRSSSFSFKGRIIYKIEDQKITVVVVRITNTHDYKKGDIDG
ncbi:hypothetical protein K2X05_08890 [bacterium]|nr:hypothetical protein [bacterium]